MPRPIDRYDFEDLELAGYPIALPDRLKRWRRAEALHRQNRRNPPTGFGGILEIIVEWPFAPGQVVAADRLLNLYENGVEVTSDTGLLFGQRFRPRELRTWDDFVEPGQALCVGDLWYGLNSPSFRLPMPGQPEVVYPTSDQWKQSLADLAARLERVVEQDCLVVLVTTLAELNPRWQDLVKCPTVTVSLGGNMEADYLLGQYLAGDPYLQYSDTVADRGLQVPVRHSYDELSRDRLWEAMHLVSWRQQVDPYEPFAGLPTRTAASA